MKFIKSEKFQKIFYPIFYLLFTIAITISGCFIFTRYYYTNIFVSGPSMLPTLVGNDGKNIHHYGIADTSDAAINSLKRFDVLITHYPESWHATDGLIVKRIWGFPGETITLVTTESESVFTVTKGSYTKTYTATKNLIQADTISAIETMNVYTFDVGTKIFNTRSESASDRRNFSVTLSSNQYFVMGDNWKDSTDCYTKISLAEKLERKHLQGKVICIQGYGKMSESGGTYNIYDKHPITPMYRF